MKNSLDFFLLPLYRQNGRDMMELPSLLASQATRRSARGRSRDTLMIHLTLEGTAPLSPKGYKKLLDHLVKVYFKTSGSSTTAMRTVAEWLNQYLLERNLRGAARNMKSSGLLTLAVLRGQRLNLVQCGQTHAFLIASEGLTHLHDSESIDTGLGISRVAQIRYHQFELVPQDMLLVTADPPPIWTTAILNRIRGISLENARQRLVDRIGPELQAALIRVDKGSGALNIIEPQMAPRGPLKVRDGSQPGGKLHPSSESVISEATTQQRGEAGIEEIVPKKEPLHSERVPTGEVHDPQGVPPQVQQRGSQPQTRVESAADPGGVTRAPSRLTGKESAEKPPKRSKVKPPRERVIGPALLKIGQAFWGTLKTASAAVGQLVKRMLPDETLFSIPTSVMAFIAVAVPVVVVALAATVYFQRGRVSMYTRYYTEAQYAAETALQLSEPQELREAWKIVMDHLNQAEAYQVTEDSQAMRSYAQTVLDNLNFVVRLPFQPALANPLPEGAVIRRIVVAEGDSVLYLLNETNGTVYRATLTDRGYVIDSDFICEPVPQPLIVGPLVDIVPLPLEDDYNAKVMGMDGDGNLMRCLPGGEPPLAFQMPPPDMNWGKPTAIEMTALGLYVLDPVTNGLWIFWATDDFAERPTLFFDEQIPPMGDVIDFSMNRDEAFLLHADGHLTTCTFGYPTRCEDPALINDIRDGGGNDPTIDDALFQEIQFSPPPDPSLYLLEPSIHSIYHFSVRLTFQRQFRSANPLPDGPATAFAISQGHQVFLAVGNQIYVAPLP